MNNERVIPDKSQADLVTFAVLLDGKEMEPSYQVMSIVVNKQVNRIPTARLVLRDGEASEEDFPISNKNDFAPGVKIEIKAGKDGFNQTVFKGMVIKQAVKVKQQGNAYLNIECKDECLKLTIGRQNHYYEKLSDQEIIKKVLNRNKIPGKMEPTKGKHKELIQHYATDWDFIVSRAEMNGQLVLADDGEVNIQAPKTKGKADLTLIYGDTLFEFESELDARYQWKAVKASSWNYTNQKLFEARSNGVDFEEAGNITGKKLADVINRKEFELRHSGNVQPEELQSWADASMLKSRLAKIRGTAKFLGVPEMKPGQLIELKGVGNRFNGKVYVTGVQHQLVEGSMYTIAQFGLEPKWFYQTPDITETGASGLLPSIHGVQIGKVVQIHDDPEKEDRILVKLPIIDNKAKGVWARVASLDAGKDRGAFFRPEVDDEVICGFINNDPRDAVVLGMLHSKALPSPLKAEKPNPEKGFITREKIKLLMNDKDKVVTIETPGKNTAILSDKGKSITLEDSHGNKIIMDKSGITINSIKDIKLTAKAGVELGAGTALKGDGKTIDFNAKIGAFNANGTGGAKLSSGNITTLTGSKQVLIF